MLRFSNKMSHLVVYKHVKDVVSRKCKLIAPNVTHPLAERSVENANEIATGNKIIVKLKPDTTTAPFQSTYLASK